MVTGRNVLRALEIENAPPNVPNWLESRLCDGEPGAADAALSPRMVNSERLIADEWSKSLLERSLREVIQGLVIGKVPVHHCACAFQHGGGEVGTVG